jgi:hypothetical protein
VDHNLPTRRPPNRPSTHAAWVTYRPAVDPRGVWVHAATDESRLGEVVAHAPLHGAGRPTTADIDYALHVLGYTRTGPMADDGSALVADCEPVRRAEQ